MFILSLYKLHFFLYNIVKQLQKTIKKSMTGEKKPHSFISIVVP